MARLVVGITGASGSIYGIRALEIVKDMPEVETHLVLSETAAKTLTYETSYTVEQVQALADVVYDIEDLTATISSGSFKTAGMLIAPCSIRSMGSIANSLTGNLLVRAADVTLKERRRLVLVLRETPLHLGHLQNMVRVTEIGAIVLPPSPPFTPSPRRLMTSSTTRWGGPWTSSGSSTRD